jgi:hypothetical protein
MLSENAHTSGDTIRSEAETLYEDVTSVQLCKEV